MTKTYSLYLSTLTGYNVSAVASCTITAATTITVASLASGLGAISVGDAVVIYGVVNYVSALGTGAGGAGTYTLANAVTTNAVTSFYVFYSPKTYTLPYAPINKTTLNNMTWNVKWNELFNNKIVGKCRVRCKLISIGVRNLNSTYNLGSVRCTLNSSHTNLTNGFNLGLIKPELDNTAAATYFNYLICDTTGTEGITINIPVQNTFSISIVDLFESPMVNVPEYQIQLFFDVDD